MKEIFYDDHEVTIFGLVANHCYAHGFNQEWVNQFWSGLQELKPLYEEFLHYLNTGEITGAYTLYGFTVLDTFVWNMEYDSLQRDRGRNADSCDRDRLILHSFNRMLELYHNPEQWKLLLSEDQRMDILSTL